MFLVQNWVKQGQFSWPKEGLHTVWIWFVMLIFPVAKQFWNPVHLQQQLMSNLEFLRFAHESP